MITVAFDPEKQIVKDLISQLFAREGIIFSHKSNPEKAGYALLCGKSGKKYDVILAGKSLKNASADFVTIVDPDFYDFPFQNNKSIIISYGLNSLATAIASSINEENNFLSFQFCLQRSIPTLKGHIIEPQEFPVLLKCSKVSINDALAYCVLALVFGISKEKISLV